MKRETVKKIIAFFIVILLIAGLTACGKTEQKPDEASAVSDAAEVSRTENVENENILFKNASLGDLILTESKLIVNKKTKKYSDIFKWYNDIILVGTVVYYADVENIDGKETSVLYSLDASTGDKELIFSCDFIDDGTGNSFIYLYGVENGNICFMTGDTVYCYNKDSKKHGTIKENEYDSHLMYFHDNRLYYSAEIPEKDIKVKDIYGNSAYSRLMCYDFNTDKKTMITDTIDYNERNDIQIINDRLYYCTNRYDKYDFKNNTGSGLFAVVSCNIDGSDKKIIGDYFSDPYSYFYWSPEAVYYTGYNGVPDKDEEGFYLHNDSDVKYYAMNIKTGKKTELTAYPDEDEFYSSSFVDGDQLCYWRTKKDAKMVLSKISPDGTEDIILEKTLDVKDGYINNEKCEPVVVFEACCDNFLCCEIDCNDGKEIIDMTDF